MERREVSKRLDFIGEKVKRETERDGASEKRVADLSSQQFETTNKKT